MRPELQPLRFRDFAVAVCVDCSEHCLCVHFRKAAPPVSSFGDADRVAVVGVDESEDLQSGFLNRRGKWDGRGLRRSFFLGWSVAANQVTEAVCESAQQSHIQYQFDRKITSGTPSQLPSPK